jgi:hypothetical protein
MKNLDIKAWNRLDKTKAFLKALSTAVGISTTVLIQLGNGSKFGIIEETTGTWDLLRHLYFAS